MNVRSTTIRAPRNREEEEDMLRQALAASSLDPRNQEEDMLRQALAASFLDPRDQDSSLGYLGDTMLIDLDDAVTSPASLGEIMLIDLNDVVSSPIRVPFSSSTEPRLTSRAAHLQ
jgi:hypothetical protein